MIHLVVYVFDEHTLEDYTLHGVFTCSASIYLFAGNDHMKAHGVVHKSLRYPG